MCSRLVRSVLTVSAVVLCAAPLAAGPRFDNAEYAARRAKLMAKIPDGVAVIWGAQPIPNYYRYAQNNDFMYLTGAEIPNAVLIVDGLQKASTMVFTSTEAAARADGIAADLVRDPRAFTGIERVAPMESLDMLLAGIAGRSAIVYTPFQPEELYREGSTEKLRTLQRTMTLNQWDGRLTRELQFVKHLKDRFPGSEVRDCSALVWDLRKYKSAAELALMREAGRVAVAAHIALMQTTRPGVSERALAAVFEFATRREGAQGLAYATIIMSGKNHAYGHYHAYDGVLKAGAFVILDAGPDYADYHVDISTSFPASGSFSARQKELYEVALAVHDTCLANYRPGVSFKQVGEKVAAMLKERGLDAYAKDFAGIVRYGGYNHMIGLATHDVVGRFAGPDEVLTRGFVFACDIQLFRLDEEIGIRIEDTVAITESGCENLSLGVPRTIAEIEALMREDGILQTIRKKPLD